jgi:phosphoglycerate dehydrogenase-like enzyme
VAESPVTVGLYLPKGVGVGLHRALERALSRREDVDLVDLPEDGTPPARPIEVLITAPWQAGPNAPAWFDSVRWVHTLSAGVDSAPRWMLGAPTVTCSRGVHAPQISEWVITALLTELGPAPWITEPVDRTTLPNDRRLLAGSTLGIVGLGAIGQAVAQRALALDMALVAIRHRDLPSPVDGVRVVRALGDLLEVSDALLVSAASTSASRHLIDEAALQQVKPGVHILNVARGGLIDHDALHRALDDGRVRAASLDVSDPEPPPAGHWLYTHPRVRLSPHTSALAADLPHQLDARFLANFERYQAGEPLVGLVDLTLGY